MQSLHPSLRRSLRTLQAKACTRAGTHSLRRLERRMVPRGRSILRNLTHDGCISPKSLSTVLGRVMTENNFQHQQRCSYHNRAVGQVEYRPLILLHVQEHKVHDTAARDAIP